MSLTKALGCSCASCQDGKTKIKREELNIIDQMKKEYSNNKK